MTEFQMIKAVIFDMDGTLFDSERLGHQIWRQLGVEFQLPVSDAFLRDLSGRDWHRAKEVSTTVFILTVHWLITACMSSPKFSRFWISWPL